MSRLAVLVLVLLLCAPLAGAWQTIAEEPVTVTPRPLQVGERLAYQDTRETPEGRTVFRDGALVEVAFDGLGSYWFGRQGRETLVVEVEPPAPVVNAFGREQLSEPYRIDVVREGELDHAMRCHMMPGANWSLRHDALAGLEMAWRGAHGFGVQGIELQRHEVEHGMRIVAAFHGMPCPGAHILGERTLRAGDRLWAEDLLLHEAGNVASQPAVASEFHGRASLVFTWEMHQLEGIFGGSVSFEIADGLPGVVKATFHVLNPKGEDLVATRELVGWQTGTGTAVAPYANVPWVERDPEARFVAHPRLSAGDEALPISFSFQQALDAARQQPGSKLAQFLAAHPDAHVDLAIYDSEMRTWGHQHARLLGVPDASRVEGGWTVRMTAKDALYSGTIVAYRGATTSLGDAETPRLVVLDETLMSGGWATPRMEVLASEEVARLVALAGVRTPRSMTASTYATDDWSHASMSVSEMPASWASGGERESVHEGRAVWLDRSTGRVHVIYDSHQRVATSGLLAPPSGAALAHGEEVNAFQMLTAPLDGLAPVAQAVAAAGGLAILALIMKLLVLPLYTRLKRDRLLEHSVRAVLFAQARASPGITRAELIVIAGVGEGATRRHLDELLKHGLLLEVRHGFRVGYAVAADVPPQEARRAIVLRHESARRIHELFVDEPHLSLREAAARLGMSAPNVHRTKKRLEREGLLPVPATARR